MPNLSPLCCCVAGPCCEAWADGPATITLSIELTARRNYYASTTTQVDVPDSPFVYTMTGGTLLAYQEAHVSLVIEMTKQTLRNGCVVYKGFVTDPGELTFSWSGHSFAVCDASPSLVMLEASYEYARTIDLEAVPSGVTVTNALGTSFGGSCAYMSVLNAPESECYAKLWVALKYKDLIAGDFGTSVFNDCVAGEASSDAGLPELEFNVIATSAPFTGTPDPTTLSWSFLSVTAPLFIVTACVDPPASWVYDPAYLCAVNPLHLTTVPTSLWGTWGAGTIGQTYSKVIGAHSLPVEAITVT